MSGTIHEKISLVAQTVSIFGNPGAKLTSNGDGVLITLRGGTNLTISDLVISGATGLAGYGIEMPQGNASSLSLYRVKILSNSASGLHVEGGSVSISESTISDNQRSGIFAFGANITISGSDISRNLNEGILMEALTDATHTLIVSSITVTKSKIFDNVGSGISGGFGSLAVIQSEIRSNAFGGILLDNPTSVDIRNNFVARNGSAGTPAGGIKIYTKPGSRIDFNTIVGNLTYSANEGGVICNHTEPEKLPLIGNLIFKNFGNAADTAQISSGCDPGNSLLIAPLAGAGFRSETDYHLTSASPPTILDAVDCTPETSDDIDGDGRPQGVKCDLGADEYRP